MDRSRLVAAPEGASADDPSAVTSSLEALRRQCAENNEEIAAVKRSLDGLRGVVAGDSSTYGKMLVDFGRDITTVSEAVSAQRDHVADLVRSVEALRVGLAGFSANNRQQIAELRGSLESVERAVGFLDNRVGVAMGTLSQHVDSALDTLGGRVESALTAMGQEISSALGSIAGRMRDAFDGFGREVGEQVARQGGEFDALLQELRSQALLERLNELESLLTVGLPQFSEGIQTGVQQTLVEVSRTLQLTEREHGNRLAELHRDFDATARRLEASIKPRRREEPAL